MATTDSRGAPAGTTELASGALSIARKGGEPSSNVESRALAAIMVANQEFRQKTDEHLQLPITLLVEQRDRALVELEVAKLAVDRERERLVAEQDSFIVFLTEDHQKQLGLLEQQLAQARVTAERTAALAPVIHNAPFSGGDDSAATRALEESNRRIDELQEQLENAYREVDESRKDGWRLQEERDDAIRATDDLRIELLTQVDQARDDVVRLELGVDEANRKLEDTRDQAREEQCRLIEELDLAKGELDERRAEVTRLRDRLSTTSDDFRPSRPPPPPNSGELEVARAEATAMRKQLVEAKRELARVTREIELMRAPQRTPLRHLTPVGEVRPPLTRSGTTSPGLPAMRKPDDGKPGQ